MIKRWCVRWRKRSPGRVKITGFLNATTNIRMRSFKSAVRSLLGALSAKGVDLISRDEGAGAGMP